MTVVGGSLFLEMWEEAVQLLGELRDADDKKDMHIMRERVPMSDRGDAINGKQMGKGGWIIVAGGGQTDGAVWNDGDGRRAGGERTADWDEIEPVEKEPQALRCRCRISRHRAHNISQNQCRRISIFRVLGKDRRI